MSALSSSTHPAILKAREQAQAKPNKMSITQTFYLAHQARGKLSSEAAKSDHDLRFLVGHANLLDRLMLHLSQAEQEQDAWFNNMVSGNVEEEVEEKMRSWETIPEEEEPTWLAQDYSDSDSESDDEEYEMEDDFSLFPALTLSKKSDARSYVDTVVEEQEIDEYASDEDELDDNGFYSLERTTSHRPPSLVSDESDDDDDEDSTPPSPPQPTLSAPVLSEKQRKQIVTTSYYDEQSTSEQHMIDEAFYLSSRPNMISAF